MPSLEIGGTSLSRFEGRVGRPRLSAPTGKPTLSSEYFPPDFLFIVFQHFKETFQFILKFFFSGKGRIYQIVVQHQGRNPIF